MMAELCGVGAVYDSCKCARSERVRMPCQYFQYISVYESAFERLDQLKLVRKYVQYDLQDSYGDRLLAVRPFLRCTIY